MGLQRIHSPQSTCDYEAIIIGAGISGLVAASVLLQQGNTRLIIVDEYPRLGGNHIDRAIGEFTFDVGSFIFQDDSPFLAHFPEILPKYVTIKPSWGRLNPYGRISKYPISVRQDIVSAGAIEWGRILGSLLYARMFQRSPANAKDFARFWIGARLLARSGLGRYLERFYGLPAENIEVKFAEKRMMWIREHAMLRTYLHRGLGPKSRQPSNRQLARPREGFEYLYSDVRRKLTEAGVKLNLGVSMLNIQKNEENFSLQCRGMLITAKRIISTIPVEQTLTLCRIQSDGSLQSVTLISLFFSFQGMRGFQDAVLYNFSHDGAWKRLTMYSDFYGQEGGREYFTVEVNSTPACNTPEQAETDFRQHTRVNHLFVGDLRLEGHHLLSNAYPIYSLGTSSLIEKSISSLRAFGIESIGRQGAFDYQPTERDSTLKAERALAPKG